MRFQVQVVTSNASVGFFDVEGDGWRIVGAFADPDIHHTHVTTKLILAREVSSEGLRPE